MTTATPKSFGHTTYLTPCAAAFLLPPRPSLERCGFWVMGLACDLPPLHELEHEELPNDGACRPGELQSPSEPSRVLPRTPRLQAEQAGDANSGRSA